MRAAISILVALCLGCSGGGPGSDGGAGGGSGGAGGAGGSGGGSGGSGGGSGGSGGGSGGSGGGSGGSGGGTGGAGGSGGTGGAAATLSAQYPGDVGMASDPAVLWMENFEGGSVAAVRARYNDGQNAAGMALVNDVPPGSTGAASMRFTSSGTGANATDLYKNLSPGVDELFVRYYAKYQAGVQWHHTGVWVGGYNPPSNWPSPQAGLKPNGDDRFSVSFEPIGSGTDVRMDFYNYWMTMHSWMASPSGSTAYYGNTLLHDPAIRAVDDTWFCVELHIKLNANPASPAGAELGLWLNDVSRQQFTDSAPLGYWVRDKFCPDAATGTECTQYRPANPTLVPLDLQFRSTASLKINAFWPQNYITSGGAGSVWFDDMVLATRRIGCRT